MYQKDNQILKTFDHLPKIVIFDNNEHVFWLKLLNIYRL